MSASCHELGAFIDGELPPERAELMREHLTTCARCQEALLGLMNEAVVIGVGAASEARPIAMPPRRSRRRVAIAVGAVFAAAACIAVVLLARGGRDRPTTIALAAERDVDVRFSAPELDRYRHRRVVRAAVPEREHIRLSELGAFEERGRADVVVGALALNGDIQSAIVAADKRATTAADFSDRAALELLSVDASTEAVPGPAQQAAAERALSFAAESLRRDPACVQAMWNRAIALERLHLPLAAAQAFDAVAAHGESGWAVEARARAEALRSAAHTELEQLPALHRAADQLAKGGVAPMDDIARAPSFVRTAFYEAVAGASTRERLDALAPIAHALDEQFATTALSTLLARVQRSDLAVRAPVAAAFAALVGVELDPDAVVRVRDRARAAGLADISLATFLVVDYNETTDDDLAELERLLPGTDDPWWLEVDLARRAYVTAYDHRDFAATAAIVHRAEPLCARMPSSWCARIAYFAATANAELGRVDLAIEQYRAVRRAAREPITRDDEAIAIAGLGQTFAGRATDGIDAMVVAGDYLAERALRDGSCRERLRRLDFLGLAALGAHRLDDAARDRAEADALEAGECATASLRLNGETVRLGLLRRGRGSVATLRANIDRLAAGGVASHAVYLDYLRASAALLEDRARGTAQLDAVIERADANPRRAFAAVARASSFDLLVESAARARDATALAALFERRLGLVDPPRCALAIAQPDSLVALAYDAAGQVTLDEREVPTGLRALAPELVVSTTLRARLAGCARIDVLTWGPYLGAARLFSDQAWRYALRGTADAPAHAGHALVVSDAEPPAELHLARLASFPAPPGATALRGTQATPSRVLAALADADIAVIVAHGVTDANEPSAANLVLSPDEHGDYLLTAAAVSATRLSAAPVVVLAGCDAGRVQVSAEPWSLATAFLGAGARAVIAPTEPIPDDGANEIFQSLVARLRAGEDPADAVAMERRAHGATAPWLASVVVFQTTRGAPAHARSQEADR